ncbi:MAG: hypothetical protein EOP11_07010 [Proteobacteria bacterium]|nr:MAG: hypothetical protein EOP11_07010 [Pseudomonadota bacterium]
MIPSLGFAREIYGPEAGVVPFGMGRAYSAVADDWLALHYNPAGLAMVNGVELQLFDLRVSTNRDVVRGYADAKSVTSSNSLADILNEFAGKHVGADVSNITQLTLPHFALALNYNAHANVDMQNTAYPQTYTRYNKDLTISVGGAYAIGPRKDLRIGARLDFTNRTGGMRFVGIDEIAGSRDTLVEKFKARGSGLGGTFGLQYRLPTSGPTEIISSFVWQDIGKTSFGNLDSPNRPTRNDDNITVGGAVRFPIGGKQNRRRERRYGPVRSVNHLTFAVDLSHLNLPSAEEQLAKKLHVGANLDLPLLSLQLGLNQSSFTFGTSFDIGIVRVAAATYAEELGSYAGQRRDRRYVISIGSALGFKGF